MNETKEKVNTIVNGDDFDKIITFTKSDGTERLMRVSPVRLHYKPKEPEEGVPEKPKRKQSEDVIVVWDLDSSSVKSIRFDTIKKIECLDSVSPHQ